MYHQCHHCKTDPNVVVAGAVGALAGFQSLQASSEARLLQLLAERTAGVLEPAKHLNWLPDQPPRTALGHSAYIQDLLPFLKVTGHDSCTCQPSRLHLALSLHHQPCLHLIPQINVLCLCIM